MSNSQNTTRTPHKWQKEIKAWADGHTIQYRNKEADNNWVDVISMSPSWFTSAEDEYRIKPDVVKWLDGKEVKIGQFVKWHREAVDVGEIVEIDLDNQYFYIYWAKDRVKIMHTVSEFNDFIHRVD